MSALKSHPLAGKCRPRTYRFRRAKPLKSGDDYRQFWRMVDGAVRDALASHPEYLTTAGQYHARGSIVKRVTGALHGHAVQTARGRSGAAVTVPAAETVPIRSSVTGIFAKVALAFARACRSYRHAEIQGVGAQ